MVKILGIFFSLFIGIILALLIGLLCSDIVHNTREENNKYDNDADGGFFDDINP